MKFFLGQIIEYKGAVFMEVLKFSEIRLKKDAVVYQIPIDKIRSNPYQNRRYFQRTPLEELAASIQTYGVLQPITVRKMSGGYYELVSGERRLQAAELAGERTIPALLVHISEYDSAVMAFVENIQRQNLTFLEEAEGLQSLIDDYGLTQEVLAEKLAKSPHYIAEKLRILKLEDPLKRLLVEHDFTERHAKALLRLPDTQSRMAVLEQMIKEELSVKQTEALVAETLDKLCCVYTEKQEQKEKRYAADFRLITNTMKQSVALIRRTGIDVAYEQNETDTDFEIVVRMQKQNNNIKTIHANEA